jgi:hypothetical protein
VNPSAVFFLVAMCVVVACASPEAGRARGAPGADMGNRTKVVRMHEGADPFYKTPKLIRAQNPPLTPARHADQLSR